MIYCSITIVVILDLMEQNYVDDHTAKQVSDTASDGNDTSSWNYLPDDSGDGLSLTPKYGHFDHSIDSCSLHCRFKWL